MKQITSIILVLFCVTMYSQNLKPIAQKINNLQTQRAEFKAFKVLEESSEKASQRVASVVTNYTLAKLQPQAINDIYQNKYPNIEVTLPYDNKNITVQLYRVNITTGDFTVRTNLKESVDYTLGVYYRGIIKGDNQSLVSLSFFNDEFSGIISSPEYANLNVGKLKEKNNIDNYIVYSDKNITAERELWSCDMNDDLPKNVELPTSMERFPTEDDRCVTMYYELDYGLYTANNSDIQTTLDWLTAVFNNQQTLYDNDGISIALNETFIWETQDPYQGAGSSAQSYLNSFFNHRFSFSGDVGQLIGVNDNSGGGVAAAIGGICDLNKNRSYAGVEFDYETVPTFSWTVQVVTHENGHVLGSRHTHACVWNGNDTAIDGCAGFTEGGCTLPGNPDPSVGGTIMSYCHIRPSGINLANGFGPQPSNVISNYINASDCLGYDCVNSCYNTIEGVSLTNYTDSSVDVAITDNTATSWEYRVSKFNSGEVVIDWTATNTSSFTISGLGENEYYNAEFRNNCSGLVSAKLAETFTTTADFCTGILFTDSGGENANYLNDENIVRTILPNDTSSEKLKVTFTELNLEQNYDYLKVYNGLDTNAPLLGNYTGNVTPLPVLESTDASGALTFHFTSDSVETTSGWVATFECNILGVNEAGDYIDFSYSPNPVVDYLNVSAKNTIEAYQVYSVDGKKLQSQKSLKDKSAKIDLSNYPSGTYVIQLQFKNKPVSFKVVKK